MTIYYILAAILLCIGLYALLAFIFALPSRSTVSAIKNVFSDEKDDLDFSGFLDKLAYGLAKHITFPQSWLKNLSKTLLCAHITMPADVYVWRALIQAPMIMLLCLACSIVVKPLIYAAFIIPFILVYSEIKKADNLMKKYRASINAEILDFVSTLANELQYNHDIVRIMSSYIDTAGPALAYELRITTSDMKTSDYASALQRLADRVNTTNMDHICRGLIGIQQGNNEISYFNNLYSRLKEEESHRMKEAAQSNIPKLSLCMIIQLFGIVVLFIGVLIVDILNTSSVLF